jgi:transposase
VARSKIVLSGQESGELERRIYASTVAVRDRQRAEIVVLSAAGISPHQIAARVGVSRVTVNLWCQRFLANRLAGLEDATGRGRKPSVPREACAWFWIKR